MGPKIWTVSFRVEMNAAWQQRKRREFCKEQGIHVSAWSPLGANGAYWGSLAVMESPILKQIANARGKSIAQVSLRWLYEQGVSVVVKSFNKERMKEILQIFDWALSEQDLQEISQIPQHRGFLGEFFVSPGGPFKTIELWDEEELHTSIYFSQCVMMERFAKSSYMCRYGTRVRSGLSLTF
ncbi:non-functional NADPH-dependent codeinone reductase 2-like [Magnolia sinica]|uniref:non-functional NADPH-dependent codeinone reductase 2-like n=1 Tax=Magnolia sinica TaxID=86752 RepID=UPI0026580C1D|nr:non-functional NADPH-dependent codeinone reductase 2-like [Magnolia sinica]